MPDRRGSEPARYEERRFLKNVNDARDNGFDLVCALCGCGMDSEGLGDDDMHEADCPNRGRDRAQEMVDFIAERLGKKGVPDE